MSRVAEPYAVVRVTERTYRGGRGTIAAYRATEAEGLVVAAQRHAITGADYEVWPRPPGDVFRDRLPSTLEA